MHSELAKESKRTSLATAKLLSPEQRLNAFLNHSQFMAELYLAGKKYRLPKRAEKK